jgi:hypothetical protein
LTLQPQRKRSEARKLQLVQQQLEGSQDTDVQMKALNQGINLVWKLGKLEVKTPSNHASR